MPITYPLNIKIFEIFNSFLEDPGRSESLAVAFENSSKTLKEILSMTPNLTEIAKLYSVFNEIYPLTKFLKRDPLWTLQPGPNELLMKFHRGFTAFYRNSEKNELSDVEKKYLEVLKNEILDWLNWTLVNFRKRLSDASSLEVILDFWIEIQTFKKYEKETLEMIKNRISSSTKESAKNWFNRIGIKFTLYVYYIYVPTFSSSIWPFVYSSFRKCSHRGRNFYIQHSRATL